MNDSEKALDQLKVIRSMMERATVYRALSAPAAIFGGTLAIVVGIYFYTQEKNGEFVSGTQYFWTWVVALIIGDSFNGFLLLRRAKSEGKKFFSAGLKLTFLISHLNWFLASSGRNINQFNFVSIRIFYKSNNSFTMLHRTRFSDYSSAIFSNLLTCLIDVVHS